MRFIVYWKLSNPIFAANFKFHCKVEFSRLRENQQIARNSRIEHVEPIFNLTHPPLLQIRIHPYSANFSGTN